MENSRESTLSIWRSMQANWVKINPDADKEKVKKLASIVHALVFWNYGLFSIPHIEKIDLCLELEDEVCEPNGLWVATENIIKEKYGVETIPHTHTMFQEQQALYNFFSAMREFYFYKEIDNKRGQQ